MRRRSMSKRVSKRSFKRGLRTHRKNVTPPPSRGGYRF